LDCLGAIDRDRWKFSIEDDILTFDIFADDNVELVLWSYSADFDVPTLTVDAAFEFISDAVNEYRRISARTKASRADRQVGLQFLEHIRGV